MFATSLLVAALAFTSSDARLAHESAARIVSECTPRDGGTAGSARAAELIATMVRETGAAVSVDRFRAATPDGICRFSNVVAEFKRDESAPWVVLLSHFDTKPGVACPGANDGASTSGLLVALSRVLAGPDGASVSNNVMMVWTDGEECRRSYLPDDGLQGARHAAAALKASGRKTVAVVCLDMLGDRDLKMSIPRNASGNLRRLALESAKDLSLADAVEPIDLLVRDDHVPFLQEGFPAIDLIDFSYGSRPDANDWWHTPEDTMDKVSVESLRTAGRLVTEMLVRLAKAGPSVTPR